MDEDPQPGLLPIIPRFPAQQGPSPLIPFIVLVIVGTLRWGLLEMLEVWGSFETESYDWSSTIDSIQSRLSITALLIPICLLLAISAFGIPRVNPRNAPPSDKALTRNHWSAVLLLVVITALLLSIPIRSIVHSPWQQPDELPPPPPPMYTNPGSRYAGRSHVVNGVCQELGILKRRCEYWKGNLRDSVCRELAVMQKRCERSTF